MLQPIERDGVWRQSELRSKQIRTDFSNAVANGYRQVLVVLLTKKTFVSEVGQGGENAFFDGFLQRGDMAWVNEFVITGKNSIRGGGQTRGFGSKAGRFG
jgi:hypothetical protein